MSLSSSQSKVCFFYDGRKPRFKSVRLLKAFITRLLKREGVRFEKIHFIFCSDKKLLEINKNYLGHDYYTDVISFNLTEGSALFGEIYISIDRVRENSHMLKNPFSTELIRVMFHGLLHFCGYSDRNLRNKIKMEAKENWYLKAYVNYVSRGTRL